MRPARPMLDIPTVLRATRLCGVLLTATLALFVLGCGEDNSAGRFGFEVVVPAGWTYVSGGVSAVEGAQVRYDEDALERAIDQHAGAPLFALLKRAPPQHAFNPTFGVNLERDVNTRGQSALTVLQARVAQATAHGAFALIAAPAATHLAGLAAASAELRAAPTTGGEQGVNVRVRLHVLVVDDTTLLLAATDAESGADDATAEFRQIIDSLRLPGAPGSP